HCAFAHTLTSSRCITTCSREIRLTGAKRLRHSSMRHPPAAKLSHHGRFTRYRKLFRPPPFHADTEALACGEWKIDEIDFQPFPGLMVLEHGASNALWVAACSPLNVTNSSRPAMNENSPCTLKYLAACKNRGLIRVRPLPCAWSYSTSTAR